MEKRQLVIVGAGIAGASAAWAATRRGLRDVLLLERATQPGSHSTGRNAAILRTAIPDPALHALARESAEFYRHAPNSFTRRPLIESTGLFLTAEAGPDADALDAWIQDPNYAQGAVRSEVETLRRQHPYLRRFEGSVWFLPEEGGIDVDALLQAYLRGSSRLGAELRTCCAVTSLSEGPHGSLILETATGRIQAEQVVLATGGWAGLLPRERDWPLPFQPRRRHLVQTAADPGIRAEGAVVWNLGRDEFYFRPESGGLLVSACDHVAVPPAQGELLDRDGLPEVAEKTLRWLPGLPNAAFANAWAGMRTFAEDHRFVIGPDPAWPGLHWLAGLGGHGITCSYAAGQLAADWIVDGNSPHPNASELAPARFRTQPTAPMGASA